MIDDEVNVCDPCHCADRDGAYISRYWVSEHSITLKTGSCHDSEIIVTSGAAGCHYDNLECRQ